MPNVWIVRKPERDVRDIEPAKLFGELCIIYPKTVSPLDLVAQKAVLTSDVMPMYGRDDLILMIGPMVMVVTLCIEVMKRHEVVRLLVWDVRKNKYVVKTQTV